MSEIVHVRHPVPVFFFPRRGMHQRLAFRRETTALRLRDEDPGAFRLVHAFAVGRDVDPEWESDLPIELHEFEGALWTRLRLRGRHDLLRLASGEWEGKDWLLQDDLGAAFAGTPVLASVKGLGTYPGARHGGVTQGDDAFLARARVVSDEGARAVRALQDFMEQDVVVAGETLFVRSRGPLAVAQRSKDPDGPKRLGVAPFPRQEAAMGQGHLMCGLGHLDSFAGLWRRGYEHVQVHPALDAARAALPPELTPADDALRHFVNAAPGHLVGALKAWASNPHYYGQPPEHRAPGRERLEALEPWAARGRIGAIFPDEFADVVQAMRATLDAVFALSPPMGHPQPGATLPLISGWIDEIALPTLRRGPALSEEDAAALTGLGP